MNVLCPYCFAHYDDRQEIHSCAGKRGQGFVSITQDKAPSLLRPATTVVEVAELNRLREKAARLEEENVRLRELNRELLKENQTLTTHLNNSVLAEYVLQSSNEELRRALEKWDDHLPECPKSDRLDQFYAEPSQCTCEYEAACKLLAKQAAERKPPPHPFRLAPTGICGVCGQPEGDELHAR